MVKKKVSGRQYLTMNKDEEKFSDKSQKLEKLSTISNIFLSIATLIVTIIIAVYQIKISNAQNDISEEQLELERTSHIPIFTYHENENAIEIKNQGGLITNAKMKIEKMVTITVLKNNQLIVFYYSYPFYFDNQNYTGYDVEHSSFSVEKNTTVMSIEQVMSTFRKKLYDRGIDGAVFSYDLVSMKFTDYFGDVQFRKYMYYQEEFNLVVENEWEGEYPPIYLDIDNYNLERTYDLLADDIAEKLEKH